MSATRDILFNATGSIDEVARAVNAVLNPREPLTVRTIRGDNSSWRVADGASAGYPLSLMDTSDLDGETVRGFAWLLEIDCRIRGGETAVAAHARYDRDASEIMRRLGSVLGTRCILLSDMQTKVAEYSGKHPR